MNLDFYVYQLRLKNSELPFYIGNGKPGRPTMKKLFPNLGIDKIVKKITNGWNPVIDESWLKYTSKESKNVGI